MNKCILALLLFYFSPVYAQIPSSASFASNEIGGVTKLDNLQIMSLGIINDTNTNITKKGRVNSWGGFNSNATIGNYPSNYNTFPAGNETWVMNLYSDGRFRISASGWNDLCITFNTESSDFSAKEFGRNGKRVYLSSCANSNKNQYFFLQKSQHTIAKPSGSSFVIRSISQPYLCLSTMRNNKKSASSSPLTMQDCRPNSDGFDRWRITNQYNSIDQNQNTANTLHLMATVFALHNYSRNTEDGTREMIYNKDIKTTLTDNFSLLPLPYYRKIPFMNPLDGENIDVFYNSTATVQQLHIERFKTSGFDKSIEIGSKVKVPIVGWSLDVKGKLDFKSATQLNTKLWLNVDPFTAMWFTSSLSKASGSYDINILTDLNDSWTVNNSKFSQELIQALTVCSSTSSQPICIQSAFSSD